jgi:hypothetical protein
VSKGHADAWVGFRIFQVRGRCGFSGTADVTEYTLAGCPGTKPCSSSSFFCTQSIHTTTTFCRIVRLLLRALHRTINTIEETASVGGSLCQQPSADSQIFTVPSEQPRVVELWQLVTVVYFVSFARTNFVVGRSCKVVANRSANICKAKDSAYMQSHLPHVVTMTVDQLHGVLEDMGVGCGKWSSSADFYLIDFQSPNLSA